jgi:hypothetical protein
VFLLDFLKVIINAIVLSGFRRRLFNIPDTRRKTQSVGPVPICQAGKETPSIMVNCHVRAEFIVLLFKYFVKRKATLTFGLSILPLVSERLSPTDFQEISYEGNFTNVYQLEFIENRTNIGTHYMKFYLHSWYLTVIGLFMLPSKFLHPQQEKSKPYLRLICSFPYIRTTITGRIFRKFRIRGILLMFIGWNLFKIK